MVEEKDNQSGKVKPGRIPKFKERINELLRKYKNDQELADALGVKRQTVNFWKNGDRTPDAEKLINIYEKLNISADYLLGISDIPSVNADIRAANAYTGLSEKSLNNIHALLEDEWRVAALDRLLSGDIESLKNMLGCLHQYCRLADQLKDSDDPSQIAGSLIYKSLSGDEITYDDQTLQDRMDHYTFIIAKSIARLIEKDGES